MTSYWNAELAAVNRGRLLDVITVQEWRERVRLLLRFEALDDQTPRR